jgi:hypothetical protein
MKIARQYYWGSPCFQLRSRKGVHADLDVNTRRPGMSLWMGTNVLSGPHRRWDFSFCLDVNAPLGEPHRLELNVAGCHVTLGLWPGQGSQTWDWKRSEWTHEWGWLSVYPLDHRQRWDAAHPDETTKRAARLRASGGRWGG